jgi:hypothetical protein
MLSKARWKRTSVYVFVLEFIRAEPDSPQYQPWLPIIDNPNLDDTLENHKRLRLLYLKRAPFIIEIPTDAEWSRCC